MIRVTAALRRSGTYAEPSGAAVTPVVKRMVVVALVLVGAAAVVSEVRRVLGGGRLRLASPAGRATRRATSSEVSDVWPPVPLNPNRAG